MGLFSSTNKSKTSSQEDFLNQAPSWQVPYQQGGLGYAQDIMNQGAYGGPYATGSNQYLDQGMSGLNDLYGSYGDVAGQFADQGAMLTPGQGTAYDFYNNTINNGYNSQYGPVGMLDPNVIGSAINNPVINDQIAAGTSDIQNFYDNNIAQVKANASAGGGGASSWRGLMQSDALQGAGRDIANLSSGLRGQAYGYGVDAANRANQFTDQGNQRDWIGGQTAANSLYGMGQQGMDYSQMALDIANAGGQGQLGIGAIQRGIDEDLRAGDERQYNAPQALLDQYWSIVGTPLGQEGTATGTTRSKGKQSGFNLSPADFFMSPNSTFLGR